MDDRTLEALKASIRKWDANAQVASIDDASIGAGDCALCQLFNENFCKGCPVYLNSNRRLCSGTPYVKAANYCLNNNLNKFREASRAEADFLRSLLPDGETV